MYFHLIPPLPPFIFFLFPSQQAATALSQLEQPSQRDNDQKSKDIKKLNAALYPLKKPIIQDLLCHEDKDVRLLVAICVSEIFRVLAPELPFNDKYLKVK